MNSPRMSHRPGRGLVSAALAAASLTMLASGGGTALAAPHRYGTAAARGAAAPIGEAARGAPAAGTITTVAGGVGGPGPATGISLSDANGPACRTASTVTFAAGNLYIADGSVRKVSQQTGLLTTPAGTGAAGPLRTGGPAVSAPLGACGVAVDGAGNLVIADELRHRIDVVPAASGTFYGQAMTAGHLYPVAGTGVQGAGGSGVPALKTALNSPADVALDGAGNIVIADEGTPQFPGPERGSRVRVVAERTGSFYGQAMTAGDIYTVAGTVKEFGYSGDGGPAVQAAIGLFLVAVRVDPAGNLVLGTVDNSRIRVVAASTGTFYGQPMTAGDIYTVAGGGTGGTANGIPATQATLSSPDGAASDAAGNLLLSDADDGLVRVVAVSTGTFYGQAMTAGDIYTIAGGGSQLGDGGPATSAFIPGPGGLAVDPAGDVLITDFGHQRVRLVAARTRTLYGQAMTAGDIYSVAGTNFADFCCDGAPATTAEMNGPAAVTTDAAGNVVLADETDNRVRVVAASTGTFYGQPMTQGDIYTVAGDGKQGFSPDGTPATQAELNTPRGVAADQAGNLVIANSFRNRIQLVAVVSGTFFGVPMAAGDIYTVAGDGHNEFSGDGGPALAAGVVHPSAVALDGAGNLLIAEPLDNRIRVVADTTGTFYGQAMTADDIYTVAGNGTQGFAGDGGRATSAELALANGVAPDRAGNLVIADTGNARVRVVAEHTGTFYGQSMTKGDIYTVAGKGVFGFAGDGGPATGAEFDMPTAVAVDGTGNVVIADTGNGTPGDVGNDRVRVIAAAAGTFYGVPMTKGDIYTVAGNGIAGLAGDGHAATGAELDIPLGVGLDGAGDLLVAEVNDGRVREVAR
jgi:trimeric autotransporter adhesin